MGEKETRWAGWGEMGSFYCTEEFKDGHGRLRTWHDQFKAQRARRIPEGFLLWPQAAGAKRPGRARACRAAWPADCGPPYGGLRTASGGPRKPESWMGNIWKDPSDSEDTHQVPLSLPHWQKPVSNSQGSCLKEDDNSHVPLLLPFITCWPETGPLPAPGMQKIKELREI